MTAQNNPPLRDDMASVAGSKRAFYGRRKGKKLRAQRVRAIDILLPERRLDLAKPAGDIRALFGTPVREAWLEIGFGAGEHLIDQASLNPDVGIIGCEPFINGMARLTAELETRGLSAVRLYDDDATHVLEWLEPASIGRAFLLYPDPWPKRRQRKRRFVSDESIAALARILKPGGEWRFATDIDDYAGWTLARILRSPWFGWPAMNAGDWRRPWPEWRSTRYEAKALREGRVPGYFTFVRNDVAVERGG